MEVHGVCTIALCCSKCSVECLPSFSPPRSRGVDRLLGERGRLFLVLSRGGWKRCLGVRLDMM